jgi:hypothetical protein
MLIDQDFQKAMVIREDDENGRSGSSRFDSQDERAHGLERLIPI